MSFEYYVIYKPYMVMCQFSPIEGKKTLLDLNLNLKKDIYPLGRLDEDSEGLLLLTNDKSLNNKILNPLNNHSKTYLVQVEGIISDEAILKIKKGNVPIKIKGSAYNTLPAEVRKIEEPDFLPLRNPPIRFRVQIPTSWICLTIYEGKNRQIRKVTAAVGFPTLRLIRFAIENLTIENFKSGEIKSYSYKEWASFYDTNHRF